MSTDKVVTAFFLVNLSLLGREEKGLNLLKRRYVLNCHALMSYNQTKNFLSYARKHRCSKLHMPNSS